VLLIAVRARSRLACLILSHLVSSCLPSQNTKRWPRHSREAKRRAAVSEGKEGRGGGAAAAAAAAATVWFTEKEIRALAAPLCEENLGPGGDQIVLGGKAAATVVSASEGRTKGRFFSQIGENGRPCSPPSIYRTGDDFPTVTLGDIDETAIARTRQLFYRAAIGVNNDNRWLQA